MARKTDERKSDNVNIPVAPSFMKRLKTAAAEETDGKHTELSRKILEDGLPKVERRIARRRELATSGK